MDILLIENDARRRIAAADRLAMAGHRVTLSSSVREAREILRFVADDADAPEAVVIAEALEMADRTHFHEEMADRFPDASWIPFRPDLGLDWLQDWLDRTTGSEQCHTLPGRARALRHIMAERMGFEPTNGVYPH